MVWNPPDPSDYVDMELNQEETETYSIRVFHPDRTPTIEEYTEMYAFDARVEELWLARVEYEVINGPEWPF